MSIYMYMRNVKPCRVSIRDMPSYMWIYIHVHVTNAHVSTQEISTRVYEKCLYIWYEREIVYIHDRNRVMSVYERCLHTCI